MTAQVIDINDLLYQKKMIDLKESLINNIAHCDHTKWTLMDFVNISLDVEKMKQRLKESVRIKRLNHELK